MLLLNYINNKLYLVKTKNSKYWCAFTTVFVFLLTIIWQMCLYAKICSCTQKWRNLHKPISYDNRRCVTIHSLKLLEENTLHRVNNDSHKDTIKTWHSSSSFCPSLHPGMRYVMMIFPMCKLKTFRQQWPNMHIYNLKGFTTFCGVFNMDWIQRLFSISPTLLSASRLLS